MAAGTFITTTLAADDSVLRSLKSGDQYYKCTASGTTDFISTKAYGTWEFSVFKSVPLVGNLQIKFISEDQLAPSTTDSGYILTLSFGGNLQFTKYVSGTPTSLFLSNAAYLSLTTATWYSIKIVRSAGGTFTISIKGGDFGDVYTLVSVNTGSNPVVDTTHTSSSYMVFDMDAGDGFMWTPDERRTSVGGTQYGVNPLIKAVPKTAGAVNLTV